MGFRPGSEVVQLYLGFPKPAQEPPRQLKGFEKIHLNPWQCEKVEFHLDDEKLAVFDEAENNWVVHDGVYKVYVGSSSRDLHLKGRFYVGDFPGHGDHWWGHRKVNFFENK